MKASRAAADVCKEGSHLICFRDFINSKRELRKLFQTRDERKIEKVEIEQERFPGQSPDCHSGLGFLRLCLGRKNAKDYRKLFIPEYEKLPKHQLLL